MPYSIQLLLLIASLPLKKLKKDAGPSASGPSDGELRKVIEPALEKVCQLVAEFGA